MYGKQKCRILKDIRRKIADENEIPLVTRECGFHGECKGTCPRCEEELRYLERQIEQRAALGKRVSVVALCAGLMLGTVACSGPENDIHAVPGGNRPDAGIQELSGAAVKYDPDLDSTDGCTSDDAEDKAGMDTTSQKENRELSGDVEMPLAK